MSRAQVAARIPAGLELPPPGEWTFDPAHTEITGVARHLMITKVRGTFRVFDGTIHVAEDPEQSWVEVEIQADSIDTGQPQRDEHLRSPDFLDAARYPTLRFRSTRVIPVEGAAFRLEGDLTIRDVTKPVTLDVGYDGVHPDPEGGHRVMFTASTVINREDFGMTWNQALETGGILVSRDIKIELEISATKE